MARLLGALSAEPAGAWLDTGHIGAQAARGMAGFEDWWAAVGGRWLGAHFHDVVGLRDHLAPGAGSLDFEALGAALPPGILATLEVDWYLQAEEVLAGAGHLRAALLAAGWPPLG
jgi:sugar phosphate isomerase/epimerase